MRVMIPVEYEKWLDSITKLLVANGTKLEIGHDLEVDGKIILNGANDLVDKNGNPLINGGGTAQVQSDWTEEDTSKKSFILHKPTIFSGNYNDLTNKPTIPEDVEINPSIPSGTTLNDLTALKKGTNYYKSTKIEYIELTGTTSGTISEVDMSKLIDNKNNCLILDNEIYRLEDNKQTDGYLAYSHTEKESTNTNIKIITITISTSAWVLVEKNIPNISVEDVSTTDNTAKKLTLNNVEHKFEHTIETVLYDDSANIVLNYEKSATTTPISYLNEHTLSEFDYIVIYYVDATGNNTSLNNLLSEEIKIINDINKTYTSSESHNIFNNGTNIEIHQRNIQLRNNNFSINSASYVVLESTPNITFSINNKLLIPCKIIGYKYSN